MPNHVRHVCRVEATSPELLEAFVAKHIRPVEDSGKSFDFDTIIPMPESLRISASSDGDLGMAIITGLLSEVAYWLHMPWMPSYVRDVDALRSWAEQNRPEALPLGRKMLENILEHGHPTWYPWSVAHWGTKWNAYAFRELGRDERSYSFEFETAWSHPEPIFRKLTESDCGLTFYVEYCDEGSNFAGSRIYRPNGAAEIDHVADDGARIESFYVRLFAERVEEEKEESAS